MRSRILHHLEAILKIGSIAEVSRQYFIAQPSLSQFVKRLEEEHRITIFDRSQSPWVLTPEGRYFLETERRIDAIRREREQYLEDLQGGAAGELLIGSTPYRSETILSRILPEFARRFPKIQLRITEGTTKGIADAVASGAVDCGFVVSPMVTSELDSVVVTHEAVWVALPLTHPLARNQPHPVQFPLPEISFALLRDTPFIIMKPGQAFHNYFESLCRKFSIEPRVTLETQSITTVPALVAAGVGAALVPETIKEQLLSLPLALFSLGSELHESRLCLVKKHGRYVSTPTKLFYRTVTEVLNLPEDEQKDAEWL